MLQTDLFVSHRERYISAYRRAQDLERRMSERLRQEILIPFFGGCCCRQHNCAVNWETGRYESPIVVNGRTYHHHELAKISRRYDYEQRKIWDQTIRLKTAFARYF